jgi:hypothetical protein
MDPRGRAGAHEGLAPNSLKVFSQFLID